MGPSRLLKLMFVRRCTISFFGSYSCTFPTDLRLPCGLSGLWRSLFLSPSLTIVGLHHGDTRGIGRDTVLGRRKRRLLESSVGPLGGGKSKGSPPGNYKEQLLVSSDEVSPVTTKTDLPMDVGISV